MVTEVEKKVAKFRDMKLRGAKSQKLQWKIITNNQRERENKSRREIRSKKKQRLREEKCGGRDFKGALILNNLTLLFFF